MKRELVTPERAWLSCSQVRITWQQIHKVEPSPDCIFSCELSIEDYNTNQLLIILYKYANAAKLFYFLYSKFILQYNVKDSQRSSQHMKKKCLILWGK